MRRYWGRYLKSVTSILIHDSHVIKARAVKRAGNSSTRSRYSCPRGTEVQPVS